MYKMKRLLTILTLTLLTLTAGAQRVAPLEQLKDNPRKAYGNDYPYQQEACDLTRAPKGYKPFYISHYARHKNHLLTQEGEAFHDKFMAAKRRLSISLYHKPIS